MTSLNTSMPRDFEGRAKIVQWLITLNQMRAADELTEDQSRQVRPSSTGSKLMGRYCLTLRRRIISFSMRSGNRVDKDGVPGFHGLAFEMGICSTSIYNLGKYTGKIKLGCSLLKPAGSGKSQAIMDRLRTGQTKLGMKDKFTASSGSVEKLELFNSMESHILQSVY